MKNRKRMLALLLAGFMSVTTAFQSTGTVALAAETGDAETIEFSEEAFSEEEIVQEEETAEDVAVTEEASEESSEESSSEEEVTITSIADVLKAAKGEFTVQGVVNFVNGKNVYLQDDTAAICAYLNAADSELKAGNLITVKGSFKDYNGLAELEKADIVEKDASNTKTYEPVVFDATTLSELVENHDNYESQKVVVKGVTLSVVSTEKNGKTTTNYYVASGETTMLVYNAAKTFADMAAGDTVNVTAIVGDYKGGQLLPISAEKVTGVTADVEVTPAAGEIKAGQELTMTCATSDAKIFYSINGAEEFSVYDDAKKPVIAAEDFVKASEEDEARATVVVYAQAEGIEKSAEATIVYTQAAVKEVKSSPKAGAVKKGAAVTLATSTEGAKISYSLDKGETWTEYKDPFKLETLPATVMVKASCEGYLDYETTLEFTEREDKEYNIYFGQLHSHTSYSDGAGTCEEAFNHAANEVENLDFLAVTDHSNSFDNDTSANIDDGSVSSEWVEGHELADKYTTDDFVSLYGYEMTWSGGAPGHMNTFNTDGFMSRNMKGYESKSRTALQNYYAELVDTPESISMFNHPGTTFGDFYDFAYYSEENDARITLIEVGNGEGAIGSAGYFPSYEYYTRALDKGWHVAPANNQDNHKGRWGDANTGRSVILADSLTREDVYDAIRNMRVYATEDNDLNIYYTLNGEVMGTVLEEKPETVKIKVKTSDATDSGMMNVEVVVNNGAVAASQKVEESAGEVEFDLAPDFAYYYIRVTQADGDIAVTAPVWVSDVEALGVSGISTDTALPVAGEALDITTTFYNNEAEDFQVDSVVYTANGAVIEGVAADLSVIKSQEEVSHKFTYKCDEPGKKTIEVTLYGKLNGVPKKYTASLELVYVSDEMVTHVVVDGSHLNDYVTGYYGGNVGNFADIAAADFVKVDVVKDQITKETLENAAVLVLSAPNKNTKYGEVMHFEDSFVELVKEYVAGGGNLILCGLADYQDTADGQSSVEINKILEAIGATTRINSDEVIDEVHNGGQEYRLYPMGFNRDCYLNEGVSDTQVYSAYSGCSVLVNDEAVAAGKAEVVVSGYDTTYTKDCKQFDANYVEVPKGSVVFAAREELTSGSDVLVTGTVFLSNFEVKSELDYGGQEYYANRNILLNYLSNNRKEIKVSTIAEMRKGNPGDIFTVEGYVTAGTAVEGNKFFDTIYVQDETAGTTVFPVPDAGIEIGTKVRLTGFVDGYQGDKEIQIYSYKILDAPKKVIQPKKVTTKEAADYEALGGSLLRVEGEVTGVVTNESGIDYFYVKDESGVEARVFIDGYILASDGNDTTAEDVQIGNYVSAVGLSYMNPDGACLRVRDRAEIASRFTVTGISDAAYTGEAVTFDNIKVFSDRNEIDAKNYKVTYSNNKKVYTALAGDSGFDAKKAPTVTVTLKGDYSGTYKKSFRILPADITAEPEVILMAANGKEQKVVPSVQFTNAAGKTVKLSAKTDFEVSYPDESEGAYKNAGEWNIVVTGKGNYTGSRNYILKLYANAAVPMSKLTVKGVVNKDYTGAEITQDIKVYDGKKEVASENYEVSYKNNVEVGTATVVVTGKGTSEAGYFGTKEVTFKINGKSISKVKVDAKSIKTNVPYTGIFVVQDALVVTDGKTTLVEDKDYTVTQDENSNVGTRTAIITGKGAYTGTKLVKFTIVKAKVDPSKLTVVAAQNVTFAQGGVGAEVTVTLDGVVLTEGIDYTVRYKNNKKVYTDSEFKTKKAPVAVVKFIGGFSGKSASVNFTIVPKAINAEGMTIAVSDVVSNGKKGGFKSAFKVYDGFTALKASDYKDVTYTLVGKRAEDSSEITPVENKVLDLKKDVAAEYDVIRVSVKGKSAAYSADEEAVLSADYCVLPASKTIANATFKIKNQQFAGEDQEVLITSQDDFTAAYIVIGSGKNSQKKELKLGEDFVVKKDSYVANTKLGTAKVTLVGTGAMGGEQTVKFKIGKKSIISKLLGK